MPASVATTMLTPRASRARSSWTKRLITATDYAAVQINVGDVDPSTGKYTNTFKTFAISGYVRQNVSAGGRTRSAVGRARACGGSSATTFSRVREHFPLTLSFPHASQSESDTAISALAAGRTA